MSSLPIVRPRATRIVGIDYGLARLGIALSDEQKIIATPLLTFKADQKAEETVLKLTDELKRHAESNRYDIAEIVIGLPLMMSGKHGFLADEVMHFIGLLKQHFTVPIVTWDERLSTVQADRSLRESSLTRKRRAKVVDIVAATIILQSYLDSIGLRMSNNSDTPS